MPEESKQENKDLSQLKQELEDCQKVRDEYLTGWQRSRADFDNYKKDETKRQAGFVVFANETLIKDILVILDNFDFAMDSLSDDLADNQWSKGIMNIDLQLKDVLKKYGLEEIKIKKGDKFDPNFHEAVASEEEGDEVIEIFQKGYLLNGHIIRPVKVKIGKN